jgi:hypothetical protein
MKKVVKQKELDHIFEISNVIKRNSKSKKNGEHKSNVSEHSLKNFRLSIDNKSTEINNNHIRNLSFTEGDKNRLSLNSNITKSSHTSEKSFKKEKIKKEIIKLEEIYLKYKNKFSLKDSKDLLCIIFKMKNLNHNIKK